MNSRQRRRLQARTIPVSAGCSRAVPVWRGSRSLAAATVVAASALGSVALAGPASAATFSVTTAADSGAGSLRQAILDANNASGLDTITINPSVTGPITLSSVLNITEAVTIQGPGAGVLTVDGDDTVGLFDITTGTSGPVTISGLTLADGNALAGAGIYLHDGDLVLDQVTMTSNAALNGGAVYADADSTLTITNSTFTGNTAGARGGALMVDGTVAAITGSTFTDNVAVNRAGAINIDTAADVDITGSTFTINESGHEGGAVYLDDASVLDVATSTFSRNHGDDDGGAISADDGTLTVSDSSFTANTSNDDGGALNITGTDSVLTDIQVIDNTAAADGLGGGDGGGLRISGDGSISISITDALIEGNRATQRGGASINGQSGTVTRMAVVDNTADESIGGLYISGGETTTELLVTDSLISGNSATDVSALRVYYGVDLTVQNTTITGNSGDGAVVAVESYGTYLTQLALDHVTMAANDGSTGVEVDEGSALSIENSILAGTVDGPDLVTADGAAAVFSLFGVTDEVTDGMDGNLVGVDPLLGALADNGGPTQTLLPGEGSPVIDAGDPDYAGSATDQRGSVRVATPVEGGTPRTDMGAVEVAPVVPEVVADPAVDGVTATPPAAVPTLADTGADTSLLLPAGGGLLAAGGLLTLLGLRRRRPGVVDPNPTA